MKKITSTEELVEYMDKWFEQSQSSYSKDEYMEVHVNHTMGDVLNLIKAVKALAQRVHDLEKK